LLTMRLFFSKKLFDNKDGFFLIGFRQSSKIRGKFKVLRKATEALYDYRCTKRNNAG